MTKNFFQKLLDKSIKVWYNIITERERKIPNTRKAKAMTNFNFTYEILYNAFEKMLNNSNFNAWYELFDSETFEEDFAKFIGVTEDDMWKNKAFVEWYNEMAEEL